MNNQWLTIERLLRQAYVVLNELQEVMRLSNSNQTTQANVEQAKDKIQESLQDQVSLQQAAQNIEYQSLVQKLKAVENPITDEQIQRAKQNFL